MAAAKKTAKAAAPQAEPLVLLRDVTVNGNTYLTSNRQHVRHLQSDAGQEDRDILMSNHHLVTQSEYDAMQAADEEDEGDESDEDEDPEPERDDFPAGPDGDTAYEAALTEWEDRNEE